MFGFRISRDAPEPRFTVHSKWRLGIVAKASVFVGFLMATGCGKRTPSYSGPPNTVIKVVMKKWAIVPARIVVPQGARVELVVSTADVEHGLGIPGLGINEPVQPGKPAPIRFLAQTPGTYPMRCSILCGKGHKDMLGEIVIEPTSAASPGRQ
ncbi:MAG TPA: cupredoxin domain-containing protein [Acidobacteriaceae bacterium]|nr:cupredoxin domain-containing protein [Acidobacteriaceae bacterium]